MSLYLGENCISAGGSSAFRNTNIGEIIQSTIPLTDAGLHLLDGSLINGSGAYADFVTYMAGLISSYPDLFETEANWQTSVTDYGVCGKFVYDSVNNTVRLPKITGFTEGTIDPTVLGDLTEAGLPNITGYVGSYAIGAPSSSTTTDSVTKNGVFSDSYGSSLRTAPSTTTSATWMRGGRYDFKASNSNSIYGNSTTVQPQAIKVLYYIVIATSTKTEIEVDIDEVMTDLNGKADISLLNGKADTDLSNMNPTQTAKNTIVGWGMPDYANASDISSFPFTATNNGIAMVSVQRNDNYCTFSINDVDFGSFGGSYNNRDCLTIILNKGDKLNFSGAGSYSSKKFIPLKGTN